MLLRAGDRHYRRRPALLILLPLQHLPEADRGAVLGAGGVPRGAGAGVGGRHLPGHQRTSQEDEVPPVDLCVGAGDGLGGGWRARGARLDGRLEEVAKAVGGGYCRLQMPLRLALGVRGTVAGHRLGALEEGGGGDLFPFHCSPGPEVTMPGQGKGEGTLAIPQARACR